MKLIQEQKKKLKIAGGIVSKNMDSHIYSNAGYFFSGKPEILCIICIPCTVCIQTTGEFSMVPFKYATQNTSVSYSTLFSASVSSFKGRWIFLSIRFLHEPCGISRALLKKGWQNFRIKKISFACVYPVIHKPVKVLHQSIGHERTSVLLPPSESQL